MARGSAKFPKEMTAHWPSGARKTIFRNIPNALQCVAMGESNDGRYTAQNQFPPSIQLVISYYFPKDVFLVWNATLHQHIHSATITLLMGAQATQRLAKEFDKASIEQTFKTIRKDGFADCVEMVLVVGSYALCDFCKNYEEYLIPDTNLIPAEKECLYALPGGDLKRIGNNDCDALRDINRTRDVVSRVRRMADFRNKVLTKWENHCIVCGVTERAILEAAHKESVSSGGSDDVENGYCLCANHHRMYDSGLLDIDINIAKLTCNSESVKSTPWYKYAKQRGFKLYLPNDTK